MLKKEFLLINCAPFIEFQGVTFNMLLYWDNFEGEWPGNHSSIDPNPPKFIVNNVEYSLTYIGLLGDNSRIEITPAAKSNFTICLDCRKNGSLTWGDFTFNVGSTVGNLSNSSNNSPYLPMSAGGGTFPYEILPGGSLR